jgi:hypothetical protein
MTRTRSPDLWAVRLLPLAAAACAVGPAWTDEERAQLAALQQAVLATCANAEAALATDAMVTVPEGKDLDDVDALLNLYPSITLPEQGGYKEAWSVGWGTQATGMLFRRNEGSSCLAIVGHTLEGFDWLHAIATDPVRGAVMLATRRGEQTVATAQGVWTGSLWHRSYCPELSVDGSHFTYVESNWLKNRVMLAPTDAPERGVAIELPGVVQWPVWPGRDGTQLRSIVIVDGRVEVRDGERVVATADAYEHAFFDEFRDELSVHLITGGKTRILSGEHLSPPLDSYRWVDGSRDGKHRLLAGHEGDLECIVFDDTIVLRCAKLAWMDLADDGSTWACAVQEGEQCFVVRPDGRSGPFPPITQLVLAPDGSSLAVCTRVDRKWSWTLDGQPLGAAHDHLGEVFVLPGRGGAVFTARDAQGWWIVTPGGRDGPWDHTARPRLVDGGRRVMVLAKRGREVHRRVLPLP